MVKHTKLTSDSLAFYDGTSGTPADNQITSLSAGVLTLSSGSQGAGAVTMGDLGVWDYNGNQATHGIKVYPSGSGASLHVYVDELGAHTAALTAMAQGSQVIRFQVATESGEAVSVAEYNGAWSYHLDNYYFIGIYESGMASWAVNENSPFAAATDVMSLAQMFASQSAPSMGMSISFPIASTSVRLTGVSTPASALDATNKEYVDSVLSGNIDLSGGVSTSGLVVCTNTSTASAGPTFLSSTGALKVEGGVYAHGDIIINGELRASTVEAQVITSLSDARLKKNIRALSVGRALDACRQLRAVEYTWADSNRPDIGLIAQEVESVVPELVHTDSKGQKSVEYGKLVAVLLVAVDQLFDMLHDTK